MNSPLVYIPLITPLSDNGTVCQSSVAKLIAFSQDVVSGYVACLTSGEGWRLSNRQWETMLTCTREAAPNHTVIAGIERASTDEVLTLAKIAERVGADGVMITTPFGDNVSQEQMFDHYQNVHDAVGLALYIYNESELSNNVIQPETLIKISTLPKVTGIKESGTCESFLELADTLSTNGLKIFQGWEDRLTKSSFAHGNICSLSNLHPEVCVEAMKQPCESTEQNILALCEKYNLFSEDWYRHIKKRLVELNIISTGELVAEA